MMARLVKPARGEASLNSSSTTAAEETATDISPKASVSLSSCGSVTLHISLFQPGSGEASTTTHEPLRKFKIKNENNFSFCIVYRLRLDVFNCFSWVHILVPLVVNPPLDAEAL